MQYWLETTDVKKIQRRINRIVRGMNKSIYNDPLWKARFYAHQTDRIVQSSDDHTWIYMRIELEFIDKETGTTFRRWFRKEELMGYGCALFETMNDFIVVNCLAWDTEPRITRETTIDYRGK